MKKLAFLLGSMMWCHAVLGDDGAEMEMVHALAGQIAMEIRGPNFDCGYVEGAQWCDTMQRQHGHLACCIPVCSTAQDTMHVDWYDDASATHPIYSYDIPPNKPGVGLVAGGITCTVKWAKVSLNGKTVFAGNATEWQGLDCSETACKKWSAQFWPDSDPEQPQRIGMGEAVV